VATVLDLEPHLGSTCLVCAVGPFAHDPFQAQPTSGLEYLRTVTFEVFDELQAIILAAQKCHQPALTFNEREIAKVGAVKLENVIVRSAVQSVEVADAVLGQPDESSVKIPDFM
jgi:hypothetical protein